MNIIILQQQDSSYTHDTKSAGKPRPSYSNTSVSSQLWRITWSYSPLGSSVMNCTVRVMATRVWRFGNVLNSFIGLPNEPRLSALTATPHGPIT